MGTLLYYFHAFDPNMLPALNKISTQQSRPTAHTITKCNRHLNYASTYPNAAIRYHSSEVILHGDMDAAYLVLPKSFSLIAGHFYLSDYPPPTDTPIKTKRFDPNHLLNTGKCSGLSIRGRNSRYAPQHTNNVSYQKHPNFHGPPATTKWKPP